MSFFLELIEDLVVRAPKDASPERQIEALREEVRRLGKAVGILAQMLDESDAFGNVDRDRLRRRMATALRDVDANDDASDERTADPNECGACGKPLWADDPELTLQKKGRVCVACFQRGG